VTNHAKLQPSASATSAAATTTARATQKLTTTKPSAGRQALPRAPPRPPAKAQNHVDQINATWEPCWICEDLKAFNPKSHSAERCFANPTSAEFRHDVWKKRLGDLEKKGGRVSDRYRALGDPPLASLQGHVGDGATVERMF
jgi:hypothetical protein